MFLGRNFDKNLEEPAPLRPEPPVVRSVAVVRAAPLPKDMPILVIHNRFIELILRGVKWLELRTADCVEHKGKRIALCPSGAGKRKEGFYILGTALFVGTHTVDDEDWKRWVQEAACVGGDAIPSNKKNNKYNHGYELAEVEAFDRPVRYYGPPRGEGTVWRSSTETWVTDGEGKRLRPRMDEGQVVWD